MLTFIFRILCLLLVLLVGFSYAEKTISTPQIIAFLGPKRVGKDTSADYLVSKHGYVKYAFADPMKKALQILFQFSDEQLWGDAKEQLDPYWKVTPRQMMQFIGHDMLFEEMSSRFPQIGYDLDLNRFARWLQQHPGQKVVISDLRTQQDLDGLKKMGAVIIQLVRPGLKSQDAHISEASLALIKGYDETIINDGSLSDLEAKIEEFIGR